ncbi:IKS1 [Candida pseudojiufengensis]|uniref:IKS1 n=1 Tax=Candida pseudojiufengensis TaxID=497109 RepID=UPI0022248061|nr:IKS1 [Candida pseudojiufengensis]KAI5966200.1 IKS1 [Candida pseudojiufengensis]
MSIIPYNPKNNDVLYHNPNEGILILHDTQENSIQLLSTLENSKQHRPESSSTTTTTPNIKSNFDKDGRYSNFQDNGGTKKCPSCGFVWNEYERNSNSRRSSTTSGFNLRQPPPIGIESNTFMHNDYFKLLAQIPFNQNNNNKNNKKSSTNANNSIPSGVFNQGYFKRFFRKVDSNPLGSGAHAQVYKVEHILNDIVLGTYAVKRISVGDKYELLEQVLNEVLILYELSAKSANENNLIRYNHVWLELGELEDSNAFFLPELNSGASNTNVKSEKVPYMFILQQYCAGGHLEDLINKNYQIEENMTYSEKIKLEKLKRKNKRNHQSNDTESQWLDNFEIWKFFHDIANGVNYLHKHGILHRDLKPSNCLLDLKYNKSSLNFPLYFTTVEEFETKVFDLPKILVSDFGEGKFIDKHKNSHIGNKLEEREGNTGTLEFTAPELWICNDDPKLGGKNFINDFTYESDIYSLGLILCYLCVGKLPFTDLIKDEIDPNIARNNILKWYENSTFSSFSAWFDKVIISKGRKIDECLIDFKILIWKMLKEDPNIDDKFKDQERCNSKEVLLYLNDMKWERFVKSEPKSRLDGGGLFDKPSNLQSLRNDLALYKPNYSGISKRKSIEDQMEQEQNNEEEDEEEDIEFSKLNDTDHFNLTEEEYEFKSESNHQPLLLLNNDHPNPKSNTTTNKKKKVKFSKTQFNLNQFQTLPFYSIELILLEYLSIYSPHFSQILLKILIYFIIGIDLILVEYKIIRTGLFVFIFITFAIMLGYSIGGGSKNVY